MYLLVATSEGVEEVLEDVEQWTRNPRYPAHVGKLTEIDRVSKFASARIRARSTNGGPEPWPP